MQHSLGIRAQSAVARLIQPNKIEQFVYAALQCRACHSAKAPKKTQRFCAAKIFVKIRVLGEKTDCFAAFVWDSVVEEILGTPEPPEVTGVRLRNVKTGATSDLACEGVFIAIGHTPVTELVADQLRLDAEGYVLTKRDSTATDIPGVFAAGDVKDKVFRQAVTAAGMGCMAALEAEKFLAAQEDAAPAKAAE